MVRSANRTLVLVWGGAETGDEAMLEKARESREAGATGLIFGRNVWQRERDESLRLRSIMSFGPRQEMSAQDALWLRLDEPANLMLIVSVVWTASPVSPEALRAVVSDRLLARYPVFGMRPVRGRTGNLSWETDPDFQLDRHLVVHHLPASGVRRDLQDFVAARRGRPFDPDHPLWTLDLLQGYGEGSAVVMCSHHAMADGIRLIQVLFGLLDPLESEVGLVPARVGGAGPRLRDPARVIPRLGAGAVRAITGAGAWLGDTASRAGPVARAAVAVGTFGAAAATGLAGAMGELVSSSLSRRPLAVVESLTARGLTVRNSLVGVGKLLGPVPSGAVWSGDPGAAKTAAWGPSVPLDLIARIGKATGTSVNDVCVALVMAAFERFCREQGDGNLPDEVGWLMPVSLSGFDEGLPPELGNHFALVLARLPLVEDGFRARLAGVHRRVAHIRDSYESMLTFGVQQLAGWAPGPVSERLTRYFAGKAIGVLTNVPGPRRPMSLAGARVEGVVGWAPCSGRQAITVCVFSYAGEVFFGFGTDQTLLPDPERLVDAMEHAVAEAAPLALP